MASTVSRDGKHRGLVRLRGFPAESRTFPTKREALKWARDREEELRRSKVNSPDLRLDVLIDRYVREIAPKRKMAKSHLSHDIPSVRKKVGDMTVRDLIGTGLTMWVMRHTDVSASSRNWMVSRLYGVLRQAEHYWGVALPWEDMDRCRQKLKLLGYIDAGEQRDRRVTDTEIERIKSRLGPEVTIRMKDIIDFCVQSCMRIGEVTRITWADVDENARTVIVRDRKHPTRKFGNHCVVPLINGAFETLMGQPRRGDRVFPHNPIYLSKKFHEAAVAAGVHDVVLHDLRHEGISRLFELGFMIQEVALVSGHTSWKTLARYTHLKPASLVEREAQLRRVQKKNGRAERETNRRHSHETTRAPGALARGTAT